MTASFWNLLCSWGLAKGRIGSRSFSGYNEKKSQIFRSLNLFINLSKYSAAALPLVSLKPGISYLITCILPALMPYKFTLSTKKPIHSLQASTQQFLCDLSGTNKRHTSSVALPSRWCLSSVSLLISLLCLCEFWFFFSPPSMAPERLGAIKVLIVLLQLVEISPQFDRS